MNIRKFFAADDGGGSGGEPAGLTVEQAVSKLGEQRKEQAKAIEQPVKEPKAAPAKAEQPPLPEPEEHENPDAVEVPGESEPSDDEKIAASQESEQTTAADTKKMPSGWGEADRAAWNALTPDVQEILHRRETHRDVGIRKQINEAALAKKQADEQIALAKAERQKLGPALQSTRQHILQQLVRDFADVNPQDPNSLMKLALEHPERKVAFDALWHQLGQNVAQEREHESRLKREADAELGKFSEARVAKLLELDPTLSDAAKSTAFETEVVGFLIKDNPYGQIEADRIKHYSAEELLMARDAMRYRKAMNALKAKPPANVPKVAKPGAASDGKTGEVTALEKRHKKGGTIDTALDLLKARRAAQSA